MIRVVYRFRVRPGAEQTFVDAWTKLTEAALARVPGALGSALLRDPDDPGIYVAVARWDSREAWQAFRSPPPLDAALSGVLLDTAEVVSVEPLEEIAVRAPLPS